MNGSTENSTMLQKVGTEDYTLYDSTYMTGPEKANLQRESGLVVAQNWEWEWVLPTDRHRELLDVIEMF